MPTSADVRLRQNILRFEEKPARATREEEVRGLGVMIADVRDELAAQERIWSWTYPYLAVPDGNAALRDWTLAMGIRAIHSTPVLDAKVRFVVVFSTHYRTPQGFTVAEAEAAQ